MFFITIQVLPPLAVIPAKAGIQPLSGGGSGELDESSTACTRLRGNDVNSYKNSRPLKFKYFWLGLMVAPMLGVTAEPSEVRVYRSWEKDGERRVLFENYGFSDRTISYQLPDGWSSHLFEKKGLIRLQSNESKEIDINLEFRKITSAPDNETAALELYAGEAKKLAPSLLIRRFYSDDRFTVKSALFPKTCMLATSQTEGVTALHTFCIFPPYLYFVSFRVETQNDFGKVLNAYSTILLHLRSKASETQSGSASTNLVVQTNAVIGGIEISGAQTNAVDGLQSPPATPASQ